MKKINLILGLHNHQPVGNFDHVFEEAYQKSYLPMLEALLDHPAIRLMYHTTGPLLDWLEDHHPEFFEFIKILIERDQLEIMAGGYYEPILAVIPDDDKRGQIEMMTRYIADKWGKEARGMWMAERVWEPHLAKSLCEAGIEYITLDDYHFHSAGLNPDDLLGYYRSDEQGYGISIFPISKKLRYLIPFSPPEEALAYLHERADEAGENLLVMADDGEKFGLWPGTYEWVYEKGWLHRFFLKVEEAMAEGWLKLVTCAQFAADHVPRGRVYLPCASYFEMSSWSLPAASGARFEQITHGYQQEGRWEELQPFLKGSFWRNFLVKYEESNRMYRKMLWVSERLGRLKQAGKFEKPEWIAARRHLFKAQCNCAYWHGVFGGLYLPHLRQAVYQNLLEAEVLSDHLDAREKNPSGVLIFDYDGDGCADVLLRHHQCGLYLSPRQGGAILELDFLPASFNLLNTLRRQPEAYHGQVAQAGAEIREGESIHDQVRAKEEGLEKYLIYDRHTRGSMIDHFFSAEETVQSLQEGRYYELGDFVERPFTLVEPPTPEKGVTLRRRGSVVDNEVEVTKQIRFNEKACCLEIAYAISNLADIPLKIVFAPEFNFSLLAGNFAEKYYYATDRGMDRTALNSIGALHNVRRLSLYDEPDGLAAHLRFAQPVEVWRYPVETVSQSEGGFERVYQSSCVLPIFRLHIEPRGDVKIGFELHLERLC